MRPALLRTAVIGMRGYLLALLLLVAPGPVSQPSAADMQGPMPDEGISSHAESITYLRRFTALLMVRATFDVIAPDEVEAALLSEARRVASTGPSDADEIALDRDLLAEGSYYLVSLRYLTESGGAAWPADRPETFYANDALVELQALEEQLLDAVASRSDPLPVLRRAQHILGLTEGVLQLPKELDRFAGRDEIVERAMRKAIPEAAT